MNVRFRGVGTPKVVLDVTLGCLAKDLLSSLVATGSFLMDVDKDVLMVSVGSKVGGLGEAC